MENTILVYVGTYTRGKSEGIYVYRIDPASGTLTYLSKAVGVNNPSFLAIHPSRRTLYAVNELVEFNGMPSGAVSAFSVDQESGALAFLNQQPSHGSEPCHLMVDQTGQFLLVANYTGGNLAVFPLEADGKLGEASHIIQHHGSGPNPQRQRSAHAHSINLDPASRFALTCDLGIDKVMVYQLDLKHGKLIPRSQVHVKAGSGPRHLAFHPNGRWVYLINELGCTIIAFTYDAGQGTLDEMQTVPTLPEGFKDYNICADVHIHPSGRFLYGSNRGHDSLVIYAIDEATGKLSYVGHEPTRGKTPRNFAIDPSGTFLFAANQDSHNIVTFRIDPATGRLTPTGQVTEVGHPVCILFVSF